MNLLVEMKQETVQDVFDERPEEEAEHPVSGNLEAI